MRNTIKNTRAKGKSTINAKSNFVFELSANGVSQIKIVYINTKGIRIKNKRIMILMIETAIVRTKIPETVESRMNFQAAFEGSELFKKSPKDKIRKAMVKIKPKITNQITKFTSSEVYKLNYFF